jgi:hypothetical protein
VATLPKGCKLACESADGAITSEMPAFTSALAPLVREVRACDAAGEYRTEAIVMNLSFDAQGGVSNVVVRDALYSRTMRACVNSIRQSINLRSSPGRRVECTADCR